MEEMHSVNSTLFAENIVGRVDDSRTFYGRELNTEYVFGSFSALGENSSSIISVLGVPVNHSTTQFATSGNNVSVTELVYFNITLVDYLVPVQINIWLSFDGDRKISAYDASFRWFSWLYDDLLKEFSARQGYGSDVTAASQDLKSGLIQQICERATIHCVGRNLQYNNSFECADMLFRKVRLGMSYEFGMNTILCRSLHALMVPLRPDIHCPHVGRTGGDMCVDDLRYQELATVDVVGTNQD
ncbi:hypothetical protein H2200_013617 [Cladophialophora chaetospira]|uniref:Uncharacterized protein n=1 Tax=Cladophialophora chaetospira TaxID=386627 RepID=A0AA38WPW0_9EURO|nr:hypothetical protein H2200_013617 [Cladophialophora chaetospira]